MLPAGRRLLVTFGLFALVMLGWHPARVAAQTLLLLPAMFPAAPFDPLDFAPAPSVESSTYPYAVGTVDAQLFKPATGGQHAAIVLLLGAGDLPRSDLAVRFAAALARLGIVTLVPEPSGMLAERLTFDEVDALRASLDVLQYRDDVDVGRVGFVGLSASGGLSIVAAGQPDLRGRVEFVNSFGSYADTLALLVDVASRSVVVDGQQRDWQPEQRTLEVVGHALEDAGVDAQTGAELVNGASRERAAELVSQLPSSAVQKLTRVSPVDYLQDLRAHIYLMHDQDDPFIPFTQSRALAAAAPPGVVERYTEFSIFSHVIPDRPVPWQTFLPDLWRLYWHVHAVLLEVL
jgi:dienelactone hydrolase